jgi:hypothetical protein
VKDRDELRLWRDEGKGFFVDHGKNFQMASFMAPQERGISSDAAAVPFSRVQDKLRKPTPIHYPIPAMGDHRLRWMYSFMIPEPSKAESY